MRKDRIKNSKLFITPNVIYPAFDGGRKLTLGRVMDASEGASVTVIAFNYQLEASEVAREFFERHGIRFICFNPVILGSSNKIIDYALLMISSKPVSVQKIERESGFFELLSNHFSRHEYDSISIESIILTNIIPILDDLKPCATEIVFHNVESEFIKSLAVSSKKLGRKCAYFWESKKTSWLERALDKNKKVTSGAYTLVFLTTFDYAFYKNKGLFLNAVHKINANSVHVDCKVNRNLDSIAPFFLFPGSLNFTLNREGILWLLEVYEKDTTLDVKIYITGDVSEEEVLFFSRYSKVELLGFVSEKKLIELYSKCTAIISPIISGSGVKMKNLEGLAYKIPLIMTEFSAIGIHSDDSHVWVSDNNQDDFISKMNQALQASFKIREDNDC